MHCCNLTAPWWASFRISWTLNFEQHRSEANFEKGASNRNSPPGMQEHFRLAFWISILMCVYWKCRCICTRTVFAFCFVLQALQGLAKFLTLSDSAVQCTLLPRPVYHPRFFEGLAPRLASFQGSAHAHEPGNEASSEGLVLRTGCNEVARLFLSLAERVVAIAVVGPLWWHSRWRITRTTVQLPYTMMTVSCWPDLYNYPARACAKGLSNQFCPSVSLSVCPVKNF